MKTEISVSVRQPGELVLNRLPIAVLWVGDDIYDGCVCGLPKPRVSWLPMWVPFNVRYDCSPEAQAEIVKILKEIGQCIAHEKHFIQAVSGEEPGRWVIKSL